MALHLIPSQQLRSACRQRLEACELWLRRLLHDLLIAEFGVNYIEDAVILDQPLFKNDIKKHVAARLSAEPARYTRLIDTLQLDQLGSVICKPNTYNRYFRVVFKYEFPSGAEHLRSVIERLVPIRNALSHANPLPITDAERVLCYCNDIISSITKYYTEIGMSRDFNAPSFTRYADSIGNVEYPQKTLQRLHLEDGAALRCGDSVRFEVEVDSHYRPDEYVVAWQVTTPFGELPAKGHSFELMLEPKHVNQHFTMTVTVTSTNEWHRHGNSDASLIISYAVLPPP